MIPPEVIAIAKLIDHDFDLDDECIDYEECLNAAWRIWNAGYRKQG